MLKRTFVFLALLVLAASFAGCACSNTATPSPTPMATPMATASPSAEMSPDLDTSPDASTSPDLENSPGTGTGANQTAGNIEEFKNFKEGTEVKPEEVPNLKAALEQKYPGATISSIRHATQQNAQVYEVTMKVDGKEKTVYVDPTGQITEKTA